jgi:hypothetical protein
MINISQVHPDVKLRFMYAIMHNENSVRFDKGELPKKDIKWLKQSGFRLAEKKGNWLVSFSKKDFHLSIGKPL